MFPLSSYHEFSFAVELAIALALGLGFGFALERAGFGSARKLTAVFYLYDMAVTKVMFTAVVTTMVGMALLSGAGLFDLSEIYLEQTNWTAQIVGGLLFGAGFVIGGYCPGTAMASIATGRKDGMLFALGMLGGVWVYADFAPGLDAWYQDTASGVITLPQATGIGMTWWVLAFVAFLAFGAWGMDKLERRFTYLKPGV